MRIRAVAVVGVGIALASLYSELRAEPKLEGRVDALNIASGAFERSENGVLWQREVFDRTGVSFFRLRFGDISRGNARNVALVIRNRVNAVIAEIPVEQFTAGPEYWTGLLRGSYALLQVVARDESVPQGFAFTVVEVGFEAKGGRVLSQQDPFNPKDRRVADYRSDAQLMAAARSVAKLSYVRNGRILSCTGFMVSEQLLLTNEHCVNTAEICRSAIAIFGYQYDNQGVLQTGEEVRCVDVVEVHAGLDFALLRLAGDPGSRTRWGKLMWDATVPGQGTALYLIQHPDGQDKRVARDGCVASTSPAIGKIPGDPSDFGHLCDTVTGSSGSPVLDTRYRVVGLHHMGFDVESADWARQNRAVQIGRIVNRIGSRL